MNFLKRLFKKKQFKLQPRQLRIDGVKTVLTPKPDDAEIAAQALLTPPQPSRGREKASHSGNKRRVDTPPRGSWRGVTRELERGSVAYYKELSEKIKASKAAERRLTMRYLAYCEEQLSLPQPLYVGQIGEMEQELYKRQDVAEREGGELLKRWQKCLATVIVRQMNTPTNEEENEEPTTDITD